jgi:alkylation response protein AidB-like acyl-CoA dehydrogenase
MRFSDSETQRLVRDTARSYLADRFASERLYSLHHGESPLTEAELNGFAELGWFGLLVAESEGGGGVSLLDAAVVIEEFGYAAVPAPVMMGNIAVALLASVPASDALRSHLSSLASGQRFYTVCEGSRRRGRPIESAAPPLTAAGGTLSGTLPLVPFADVCDFVVAPLIVDGEPAFGLLPLEGTRLQRQELLDRPNYFSVRFEETAFDGSAVLATGDRAVELHERCDALVTALSLIELAGMMQRILEMTTAFVTNRVQFGQPIAKFQAVRHRAAELLMQTETTRWAAYHALWRFQEDPADTEEIWLAKQWAVRAADRIYQTSHLLHGGVGVAIDYPLHLYTQGVAAFAVRGGTMNEMVDRTVETMKSRHGAKASA